MERRGRRIPIGVGGTSLDGDNDGGGVGAGGSGGGGGTRAGEREAARHTPLENERATREHTLTLGGGVVAAESGLLDLEAGSGRGRRTGAAAGATGATGAAAAGAATGAAGAPSPPKEPLALAIQSSAAALREPPPMPV